MVMLAVVAAAGCASAPTEWRIVEGECVEAYGGNVCTWARLGGDDALLDYGVRVPMATIENAPPDMAMVWPPVPHFTLRMPAEVATTAGIDHFTMYWEAHGHPPGPVEGHDGDRVLRRIAGVLRADGGQGPADEARVVRLPMPTVAGLPPTVRYPLRFRAEYDSGSSAYRLVFTAN